MRHSRFALTATLALIALPSLAEGHAHLKTSSPEKDATVEEAPKEVTLTFSEPLELSMSKLEVEDLTNGGSLSVGEAHAADGKANSLQIAVHAPKTPKAKLLVTWKVVAKDTHKMNGKFTFEVSPKASAK